MLNFRSRFFKFMSVLSCLVLFIVCLCYTSVITYASEVVCDWELIGDYSIEGIYIGRNIKPYLYESEIEYQGEPFEMRFNHGEGKYRADGVVALIVDDKIVYADGTIAEEYYTDLGSTTKVFNSSICARNSRYFNVYADKITVEKELVDILGLSGGKHEIGAIFNNTSQTRDYGSVILNLVEDDYYEIYNDVIEIQPKFDIGRRHIQLRSGIGCCGKRRMLRIQKFNR